MIYKQIISYFVLFLELVEGINSDKYAICYFLVEVFKILIVSIKKQSY